jgi:transcriptional regulator with XRE-family HTH domain
MGEKETTPNIISNRLKHFMKKVSATGKDMAKMGHISEQAFSGYLNEKNLPAAGVLAEWAKSPGMNINWLLTGEGEMLREQEQLGENVDASALRQRIEDMGKIVAAQEKTIAAQEEMIRVYKERERFPTATGARTPTSAVLSQAPNSSEE